jgi:hypothetical protein
MANGMFKEGKNRLNFVKQLWDVLIYAATFP